jgi:hypothetical protein
MDITLLVFFKPVKATYQSGFTRAGRPANYNALTFLNFKIDVPQHMKMAEPFVDAVHGDNNLITHLHS